MLLILLVLNASFPQLQAGATLASARYYGATVALAASYLILYAWNYPAFPAISIQRLNIVQLPAQPTTTASLGRTIKQSPARVTCLSHYHNWDG